MDVALSNQALRQTHSMKKFLTTLFQCMHNIIPPLNGLISLFYISSQVDEIGYCCTFKKTSMQAYNM